MNSNVQALQCKPCVEESGEALVPVFPWLTIESLLPGSEGATQGDNQEDHSSKNKSSASGSTEGGTPQKESGQPRRLRKYICGEDSLKIPAGQPYRLYRPMCRGRLNISSQYSLQQVRCVLISLYCFSSSQSLDHQIVLNVLSLEV